MYNSKLLGHMVVFGLIFACAIGAAAWEVGTLVGIRAGSYNETPVELSWQLADGQDSLVSNIRSFRIYYKTLEDGRFSENQVLGVPIKSKEVYGHYAVALPPHVTGFRFDVNFKDRTKTELTKLPRLIFCRLGENDILGHRMRTRFESNLGFSSWLYDVPLFLNGWGWRIAPVAVLGWLVCMTGIFFVVRKCVCQ